MTRNGTKNETLTTGQGPLLESSSQLGTKCLETASQFWKGKCTALNKVGAIRDITDICKPPHTDSEINHLLKMYLQISEQHE